MERISGTFDPPPEVDDMRICRLRGGSWLGVDAEGLTLAGTLHDAPVPFNARAAGVALLAVGGGLAVITGLVDLVMPPAVCGAVGFIGYGYYLDAPKALAATRVPWGQVERVVQYPRDPSRFAFLLDAGPGLPTAVYFTPRDGDFVAQLRAAAPELPIDTAAAIEAAAEAAAREAAGEVDDDDAPFTPDDDPADAT